jgi:AsmA protein
LAGDTDRQSRRSEISELSLGDIRIIDGTVRYNDERTGSGYEIGAITAEMRLASIARPLDAKGSFVWSHEKIDFDGKLTSPQDVLEDRPAKLVLNLSGRPLTFGYDGSVALHDAPSAEGAVTGSAASLRTLAQWLGAELAPGPGFGEVSIAEPFARPRTSARVRRG